MKWKEVPTAGFIKERETMTADIIPPPEIIEFAKKQDMNGILNLLENGMDFKSFSQMFNPA